MSVTYKTGRLATVLINVDAVTVEGNKLFIHQGGFMFCIKAEDLVEIDFNNRIWM